MFQESVLLQTMAVSGVRGLVATMLLVASAQGFIDLEEMTTYLYSVFKVLYAMEPGTEDEMGVNAEELARVTAEQAFIEADVNDAISGLGAQARGGHTEGVCTRFSPVRRDSDERKLQQQSDIARRNRRQVRG